MRPRLLVLALDIGSSSVRSAFFSETGVRHLPSTASRKYAVKYSAAGGAELDSAIVLRAARHCVRETLRCRRQSPALRHAPIIAVAGSAFWHSLLALDDKDEPLAPIFMWADSRSTPDAFALRREFAERAVHARTGCMLRTPYWTAKLRWWQRTQPALFRRTARWVSPADWIFENLFGGRATSHSMASGTGLYHLKQRRWDAALCAACRVDPGQLDPIAEITEADGSSFTELEGVPVFRALGDGAASNLGSGADQPGQFAITIGTSGAVRRIVPRQAAPTRIPLGLFQYAVDDDRMVIGGAISNGGNLRQWFQRELRLPKDPPLSRSAAARDSLTILPYWVSERSPTWPENIRGTISGLTPATNSEDLFRAGTTATYYRLADTFDLLQPDEKAEIIVSGGVLHSSAALALLADCLGRDLRVSTELETSLRGGAVRALEKLGHSPRALRPGRIIRHQPDLAVLHRARRARQADLERQLR